MSIYTDKNIKRKNLKKRTNEFGEHQCSACGTTLNTNNSKGKLYNHGKAEYCGKCYLQWRREVRKRNGES